MSNAASLLKRIDTMLATIHQQREQQREVARVVLCDQDGEPLPGHEPIEQPASYIKRIILEDSPGKAA